MDPYSNSISLLVRDVLRASSLLPELAVSPSHPIMQLRLESSFVTLGGDRVSMLTHTYPHKPLRKIKVTIWNH